MSPLTERKRHPFVIFFIFVCHQSATPVRAQQNLFNVPSVEITSKDKFFYQQQFNFGLSAGNSNTTLDYGLGNNFEIGINLFNTDLYTPNGQYQNPHLLINFQKAFDISDHYKVSFGTQSGFTPPIYRTKIEFPSFSYINNAFDLDKWGKFYLGGYYANQGYAGPGSSLGLMAGIDFPIMKGKAHLMGDWITGNNDIGVAVVGAVFFIPKNWQVSFGAQLPSPESNNDYGMVFEITKL